MSDTAEPLWMLRLNPLRRRRLADPGLLAALRTLDGATTEVRELADRCSDALYEMIGATTDREARGQLIVLRRAIHNDTAPRPALLVDHPLVGRWWEARQRREAYAADVVGHYPRAVDAERGTLAGLLGDESLRHSMTLVAPEAAAGAGRYRAAVAATEPVPTRLRKSERGLVQYVTRAMIRTSPMARFTAIGLAVPGPDGPGPDAPEFGRVVPFQGLDRVMLDYVLGGLHTSGGDLTPDTLLQLPPTSELSAEGDLLYFLQPGADGGVRRLSAKVSGAVGLLVAAVAVGPRRAADVAADFAARSGCAPELARQALARAIGAGILCTRIRPEDGAADFPDLLDPAGLTVPETARRLLEQTGAELRGLADNSADERPEALSRLRDTLVTLSREAGRPAQILIEEDAVLEDVRVSTADWRSQLDDLAAGVALLSVFDWMHDIRALLSAVFVERFGVGAEVPLSDHADYLSAETYRRAYRLPENEPPGELGPADRSLDRLYALRANIVDTAIAGIDRAAATGEAVSWSASQALDLTTGLPDRFRTGDLRYGVLTQTWRRQLLFNEAYAGHGMLYGRFLGPDRALGGRALPHFREQLRARYAEQDGRLVEDPGLHRLNVNAHPPVLPDRLGPDDWFRLRLRHDPDTDALGILDPDGRPLHMLSLGTGHPERLPAPLRLANWLYSGGVLREPFVAIWHAERQWDGDRTRACPRFQVGSAMLARRRWYGGRELDEAVAAGPAEHDRLLALARWRNRHGVPEEVVLKPPPGDGSGEGQATGAGQAAGEGRKQKPQYVDLASALSVRVLPRMRERGDAAYVEEALPRVADSPHALEWIVDIGRAPDGPFQYGGKTR
ncbi:lantibiotic dehydratase family protein [Streptomyces anulatus]|uniref:lantibiotic dehydratase n=1 Tax=Streptomyces anulatus TaxID=1892 RepID=UPI00067C6A58|nr:lantibiotic dehydratase [Streptomyces anulatus]KND29238.1 hypothetical protein IQ60_23410 [Streptomyces europaeiscabiei]KPL32274.1 hypothetical protein JI76_24795 [Streptomyces anulatus]WSR78218.1 lantibiotic dehydratase family protein [Streptomyces anulatus]